MSCPLLPLEATWDTSVHAAPRARRLKLPAVFDVLGQLLFCFPAHLPTLQSTPACSESLENWRGSFNRTINQSISEKHLIEINGALTWGRIRATLPWLIQARLANGTVTWQSHSSNLFQLDGFFYFLFFWSVLNIKNDQSRKKVWYFLDVLLHPL